MNIKSGEKIVKKCLDIEVYVEEDYVYMSVHDWQMIVNVLNSISENHLDIKKKDHDVVSRSSKTIH